MPRPTLLLLRIALRLLASLIVASAWAQPSADTRAELTEIAAVLRLSPSEARRSQPVEIEGVVTYIDHATTVFFVHQNATTGVLVESRDSTFGLFPGMRVAVRGISNSSLQRPFIAQAEVSTLEIAALPQPRPATLREIAKSPPAGHWIELEGELRSVRDLPNGKRALHLAADNEWLTALLPDDADASALPPLNSRVRVLGVWGDPSGHRYWEAEHRLLVPGTQAIQSVAPPPPDPFSLPRTSLATLLSLQRLDAADRVHVRGVVQNDFTSPAGVRIADGDRFIYLEIPVIHTLRVGTVVDVVGTPKIDALGATLRDVTFRRVGITQLGFFTGRDRESPIGPAITSIAQLRSLPPEAAKGRAIQVRAVVTYYDPYWEALFVQDDTAGVYVVTRGYELDLKSGDWLDLQGISDPGGFAPVITSPRFEILGECPLPDDRLHSLTELGAGNKDSLRLRLQGTIRAVQLMPGHYVLDVVENGTHFAVEILNLTDSPAPSNLVGNRYSFTGICATIFNHLRQFTGVRLLVSSLDDVRPLSTHAPQDPFSLAVRSINTLHQFAATPDAEGLVRIRGQVTFSRPGEFLFVQDETGGLLVRSEQRDPLQVGDIVDVVGFAEIDGFAPVLSQASFRPMGRAEPVEPVSVASAHDAMNVFNPEDEMFAGRVMRIRGRVIDRSSRPTEKLLLLQQDEVVFSAHFNNGVADELWESIERGSLVEVTGVCQAEVVSFRTVGTFRLYARSPGDLEILERPPWWTLRHTIGILVVLTLVGLATLSWIVVLRRRVAAQTRLIQERLEREKALEVRYRELFESNPHPMWVLDLETLAFLAVNEAAVHHYGYSHEEFLNMTVRDLWIEDDPAGAEMRIKQDVSARRNHPTRHHRRDGTIIDVEISAHRLVFAGRIAKLVLVTDVTERLKAAAELERAHKQLLETSRLAGMAEVATSVLHNVGNVLNSVNVSATIVADQIKTSKAANVEKISQLLDAHRADLPQFLSSDPRGRQVPDFLRTLSEHLAIERKELLEEVASLRKNIEHIKEIVAMQQSYARVSGVIETVAAADLMNDALEMNAAALARHQIEVVREYPSSITFSTDRHKVLQILVNLVSNAKFACTEFGRTDKRLIARIESTDDVVRFSVIDNGVGITAQNLTRIFNHGFTTRAEGHGFGLHSGALAAKEMGGSLSGTSNGPGTGAIFTLEIPLRPKSPEST